MVMALGLGGFVAAIFHLLTHAFFKALLFMGSGSVIVGMERGHHVAEAAHGHGDMSLHPARRRARMARTQTNTPARHSPSTNLARRVSSTANMRALSRHSRCRSSTRTT